jgi:hypothetical protein
MSATRSRGAASIEEQAELTSLRDAADRSTAEVARTLAELTERLAANRPKAVAKRLAANARVTALRAVREGPGKIAGQRGARRLALAAIPVLVLAAVAVAIARERLSAEG